MKFEWDEAKNISNQRKHGVSFEEAVNVFQDPLQLFNDERVDEDGEQRWQIIGLIRGVIPLLVVHTIREAEDGAEIIRLISARYATRHERRLYEIENGLLHS